MPIKHPVGIMPRMTAPKPQTDKIPKRRADWEAVERDYRTGKYTLRELGEKHGADAGLISRNAKKNAWTQDLAIAIRQATNAKLTEQLVNSEVNKSQQKVNNTIDIAATMGANVIMGHRKGLMDLVNVKRLLLAQIQDAAQHMPNLADVIEMVRTPDDNGVDKANDALKKAMGRSALIDDLKKLADVDEKVRKGEREAFDIDTAPPSEADAFTTMINRISTGNASAFQPVKHDPAHDED